MSTLLLAVFPEKSHLMSLSLEGIAYFLAGFVLLLLFFDRRKGLPKIARENIPGLGERAISELRDLLSSAYERMLYLAISFFLLAYAALFHRAGAVKAFFTLLVIGVFLYNIPPRHKVMKLLISHDISYRELRARGIKL